MRLMEILSYFLLFGITFNLSNLYHQVCIIKFNSYLLMCQLNSTKTNYTTTIK
jgi:hypothetical protein